MRGRALHCVGVLAWIAASLAACGARAPQETGTPISAAALPHPKPGVWRWSSGATGVRRLCLSGRVLSVLTPPPACPVTQRLVTPRGVIVVEATCPSGAVRRMRVRAYGDFARAFSTDVTLGDVSDHADYEYLGPCPPGEKPDDLP